MNLEVIKKTKHKTEQMELIISILCILNGIHLSETATKVLAYYVVYGLKKSTDKLLIDSGITKSGALGNVKVDLKKLGFLKRTNDLYNSYELATDTDMADSNVVSLLIKVDNS